MGFELWYSPTTGHRRKGTSFLEIKQIFTENISARQISECLALVAESERPLELKQYLHERDFDVTGIVDNKGRTIGYVNAEELQEGHIRDYLRPITSDLLIANNTSFPKVLKLLLQSNFIFILHENEINGILTKADINKPLFRLYLFGIISLFEMHVNYWINRYLQNDIKDILSEKRYATAQGILALRQRENNELSLLDCLQLADKRDILITLPEFLETFNFSKSGLTKLVKDAETIRNEIAHSQNSIIGGLEFKRFVNTVEGIEAFLDQAEEELTK